MSMKAKALTLAMLAALAVSGIAVVNANALTGGHFTSEVEHVILEGEDHNALDKTKLHDPGGATIVCDNPVYHGTISNASKTVTEVTITPTYTVKTEDAEECEAEGLGEAHIHMNECHYVFTIGNYAHEDNTVHLVCPPEKTVTLTITGPFGTCTIHIPPQTLGGKPNDGVAYTTGGLEGKTHDITADVTVKTITATFTGGFFLCGHANGATTHDSELTGSVTLRGFDTEGKQVGITATGKLGTKP